MPNAECLMPKAKKYKKPGMPAQAKNKTGPARRRKGARLGRIKTNRKRQETFTARVTVACWPVVSVTVRVTL